MYPCLTRREPRQEEFANPEQSECVSLAESRDELDPLVKIRRPVIRTLQDWIDFCA